ncbi:Probable glutathione S-transferase [Linum grandiflorum]
MWCAEEKRGNITEEVSQHLKGLEDQLKDKRFFGGERIGIVDIAVSFFEYWLGLIQEVTGMELVTSDKFPVMCNWIHEFVGHSVVILHPERSSWPLSKFALAVPELGSTEQLHDLHLHRHC